MNGKKHQWKEHSGWMKLYRALLYSKKLSAIDKVVYLALEDRYEMHLAFEKIERGDYIEVSIKQLADKVGVSRNAAGAAVKRLEREMLICTRQVQGFATEYYIPNDQDDTAFVVDTGR